MEAFEELKCIGRGSYGAAFLVRTRDSGEQRVVKKVSISLLGEEEQEQALREVELLQDLDHPNIVDFFDHFIANDELHIVMLYCEGGDLSTRIKEAAKEGTFFPEQLVLEWTAQVASALCYMHRQRVLHREGRRLCHK